MQLKPKRYVDALFVWDAEPHGFPHKIIKSMCCAFEISSGALNAIRFYRLQHVECRRDVFLDPTRLEHNSVCRSIWPCSIVLMLADFVRVHRWEHSFVAGASDGGIHRVDAVTVKANGLTWSAGQQRK